MFKVSAIIPTYNHAAYLGEAIDSVLAQTHAPVEVIVIDDGSTDDTEEVLSRYSNQIVAVRQPNAGVSAARNRGAARASGDLLAFLDADDIWLPAKIELQVNRFLSEGSLGLVHCGIEEIDAGGKGLGAHQDGIEGWAADEMLMFRRSTILGGGSGVMIPRALFIEAGGFDEEMSTSADWDLYYRLATRRRIGFVPEVLLKYRIHRSNMHNNISAMENDMMRGYGKAFENAGPQLAGRRRQCYGNLHRMLAGSYFTSGKYGAFLQHSLRALMLAPESLGWFLGFPIRNIRRRMTNGATHEPHIQL